MYWLLDSDVFNVMQNAHRAGILPTAAWQQQVEARQGALMSGSSPHILTIEGSTAVIEVTGVMTPTPDFFAAMFGGGNTTYAEIDAAVALAEADARVKDIKFKVSSGGGTIAGLFDTLATIQAATKPTSSVASLAASAAYALVSQTDTVSASSRAAQFGSIGIAATIDTNDNEVTLTSTAAPKKRPDVSTGEGRAVIIEELDALHELFVEAIASGRGTTVDKINAEFGQGATLLADQALKRGMIDAVAQPVLKAVKHTLTTTAYGGTNPENGTMDLKTLMAQHPDVYAAAVQNGVAQERDRVTAHLTLGKASGDIDLAIKAASEGTEMTATLQATYMAAGMNRRDVSNRQADDQEANAGDGTTNTDDEAGGAVLRAVEAKLGITARA